MDLVNLSANWKKLQSTLKKESQQLNSASKQDNRLKRKGTAEPGEGFHRDPRRPAKTARLSKPARETKPKQPMSSVETNHAQNDRAVNGTRRTRPSPKSSVNAGLLET